MHTSTVLQASDFVYRRLGPETGAAADFDSLFPDYHELDRVGVVSLTLEEAILHTGVALLALTTAFYDAQRAKGAPFFNYPQHFALLGGAGGKIQTRSGAVAMSPEVLGPSWGNLDVWPESNWHLGPPTAEGMLRRAFDLQINRLFWPERLAPQQPEVRLPSYVPRMLRSRLKAVYYYDSASPTLGVEGGPQVAHLLQRSRRAVPGADRDQEGPKAFEVERFRQVPAPEFLTAMARSFEEG